MTPTFSPIAGLLVIVHFSVNVVAFSYRKIHGGIERLTGRKLHKRSFGYFVNKEGDIFLRRLLAYMIVPMAALVVFGNATVVVLLSLGRFDAVSYDQSINTVAAAPTQVASERDIAASTLVGVLEEAGIDSSFEYRAFLAFRMRIVENSREYKGTLDQNIKILSTLKKIRNIN